MTTTTGLAATLLTLMLASPALAREVSPDRVEDRLDRAENRIDARNDTSPRDRIEDRIDRAEDRWDARGYDAVDAIDRHERRTWRRLLRQE